MAHFYGTVKGNRGGTSRLGSAKSGLDVSAQSYHGDVHVFMHAREDSDYVAINVEAHVSGPYFCLYEGDVSFLLKPQNQKEWIKRLVRQHHLGAEIVREFAEEALRKQAGAS